jgi:hypothetical protein
MRVANDLNELLHAHAMFGQVLFVFSVPDEQIKGHPLASYYNKI